MRPRLVVVTSLLIAAVLGLGAVVIGGWGGANTAEPAATASVPTPSATVGVGTDGPFPTVTGAFGERPELTFPANAPSAGLQVDVLVEGDGAVVASGDLVVVSYLGQIWGGDVFDASYGTGTPAAFTIGTGGLIEGWDAGVIGRRAGSRVVLSIPPDLGYGAEGNENAGIAGTDTIVFVIDIHGTYGPGVAGSSAATTTPEAAAVGPAVVGDLGAPATVSVPDGLAEPTEARTTVLALADGPAVVPGHLVLQHSAVTWDNTSSVSTWEEGVPAVVGVGSGDVLDSLIGIPVGSRVLIELPAPEGGEAIAVVVDVVDQVSVA